MNIERIRASELTPDLEQRWLEIHSRTPALGSPYFTPHFFKAVASVRGDAQVSVLRDQGRIVGFFPFQRSRLGIGGPLGGHFSDYQAVIAEPEVEWDVVEILRASGLSVWRFDHLLLEQAPFAPFVQKTDESPILKLDRGFQGYAEDLRARGSSQLANLGRKSRKMSREVGEVRLELDNRDPALLELVIANKRKQCQETGVLDVFTHSWTIELIKRIHAQRTPDFSGILSVLWAGDTPVAAHMGMRSKEVLHWWFPTYLDAYSKYSPGLILLVMLAEEAAKLGLKTLDLGKGDDAYKKNFQTGSVLLGEGRAIVPSMTSRVIHLQQELEAWVRASPLLRRIARGPAHALRRVARQLARR